jgi:hypothetical protein
MDSMKAPFRSRERIVRLRRRETQKQAASVNEGKHTVPLTKLMLRLSPESLIPIIPLLRRGAAQRRGGLTTFTSCKTTPSFCYAKCHPSTGRELRVLYFPAEALCHRGFHSILLLTESVPFTILPPCLSLPVPSRKKCSE